MKFICYLFCIFFINCIYSQDNIFIEEQNDKLLDKSQKGFKKLERNYDLIAQKIFSKSEKWIEKIQRQEIRIQKKLNNTIDTAIQRKLTLNSKNFYQELTEISSVKLPDNSLIYIPTIDSLKVLDSWSIQFKSKSSNELINTTHDYSQLTTSLVNVQQKLTSYTNISNLLKDRKQQILQEYHNFGFTKELTRIKKKYFYYQQQLEEYKSLIKDQEKLATRLLSYVKNLPSYQDFFRQNSQLAQIFNIPSSGVNGGGIAQIIPGLQTVNGVQFQMSQSLGSNINPQQLIIQQINFAQSELNSLKEKVNELGGGQSELEMPEGFKPNYQKTKSFLKRLEFGLDFQSNRTRGVLPASTNIGISTGFKLNDKSIVGLAGIWSIGWGKDFSNIHITHQGIGWRSFIDIKFKGNWWITGGYEENFKAEFQTIAELKDRSHWLKSGLIGVTKKYKISKKTYKIQLLWDMMSYYQVPRGQALQFRTGFNF